jgi:hypothetical protein
MFVCSCARVFVCACVFVCSCVCVCVCARARLYILEPVSAALADAIRQCAA